VVRVTAPTTSPGAPAEDGVGGDLPAVEGTAPPPWGWHLSRVTGLVLAVLLPVQVLRTFVLTDVARTTARAMTVRWSDPLARVLDGAVLVLALVHGATALAPRLAARASSPLAARVATGAVWVVSGGLALAVTAVVLTYRFT
jgi:succinate dehydrogenase hydrophobic anchor subunit